MGGAGDERGREAGDPHGDGCAPAELVDRAVKKGDPIGDAGWVGKGFAPLAGRDWGDAARGFVQFCAVGLQPGDDGVAATHCGHGLDRHRRVVGGAGAVLGAVSVHYVKGGIDSVTHAAPIGSGVAVGEADYSVLRNAALLGLIEYLGRLLAFVHSSGPEYEVLGPETPDALPLRIGRRQFCHW